MPLLGLGTLKPATRQQYINHIERFLRPVFGAMQVGALTKRHVTAYMMKRAAGEIVVPYKEGAKGAAVAANRERATLSVICTYAVDREWLEVNPVTGSKKFEEKRRTRDVSSVEMITAKLVVPEWWRDFLHFLYLTGMRGQDARAMTRQNLDEDGIHFVEGKTGQQRHIFWSDALAVVVERCFERNAELAARYGHPKSDFLFVDKSGRRLTQSAQQSMAGRLKKQGYRGEPGNTWNPHDWRAAAASDTKGQSLGVHSNPEIYRRNEYTAPVK